jgi:hypothetical protein
MRSGNGQVRPRTGFAIRTVATARIFRSRPLSIRRTSGFATNSFCCIDRWTPLLAISPRPFKKLILGVRAAITRHMRGGPYRGSTLSEPAASTPRPRSAIKCCRSRRGQSHHGQSPGYFQGEPTPILLHPSSRSQKRAIRPTRAARGEPGEMFVLLSALMKYFVPFRFSMFACSRSISLTR